MSDEPCNREDLRAAVSIYYMYETKGDGELGNCFEEWDDPRLSETSEVEEYFCANCGEYFTPSERFDEDARRKAWQEAFDHLEMQEVAA